MGLYPRAYSFLHVKSLDAEQRIIRGIATDPQIDRVGDQIVSEGVSFRNPLPLLLFHDTTKPVGTVRLGKPTKSGVSFEAHIPAIAEPGTLRDRVEEAWQSIKAGLLTAVSIGFRPLDDAIEHIKETGGYRFLKTEVLELSLVVVPANAGATIQSVKSYDMGLPAAIGPDAPVSSTLAGVPARSRMSPMNVSEQLTTKRLALKTKSERFEALMAKAAGETLEPAELDEKSTIKSEVDALSTEISDLVTLEHAQAMAAAPVTVQKMGDLHPASEYRPQITVAPVPLPPGIEFTRGVICKLASAVTGMSPLEIAKERYPDHPRIQAWLKTAVGAHTTADGANVGGTNLVYATNLTSEFIEFLRPQTIIGRIPNLRRVPFNVRITGQSSGGAGYWVGQGLQKPLKRYNFSAVSLTWAKVAAIAVISEELARFSSPSAEALVRDALAGSIIERIDIDFIDPSKALVANVSPASITNGIASLTSAGTDAAGVRADIATLISAFITADNLLTSGVFIMSNALALQISLMVNALGNREFPDITMNGGSLAGFPVVTSQYADSTDFGSPGGNLLILLNAGDIFLADDGGVSIDVSREASLEMSDAPGTDSGLEMVSMYQTNQIALRAERFINWARRRTSAVAYMHDVTYNAGSPA